jgi:hypothetical protein
MYERPLENTNKVKTVSEKEKSIWGKIFSSPQKTKDPNHKELWFFSWKEESTQRNSFLTPLPTVVLIPLISKALNTQENLCDVDINITTTQDKIGVFVSQHNDKTIVNKTLIDYDIIQRIKKDIKKWRPADSSEAAEFDIAYRYLSKNDTTKK